MKKIGESMTGNTVHKYVIKNSFKESQAKLKIIKEQQESLITRKATKKDLEVFEGLKPKPKSDEYDRYTKSNIGRKNEKYKTYNYR